MLFQFAQDEDSCIGDFAVVEYETAEQAEKVQEVTDGMIIKGKRIQVSYCAPGAPGRSTLAALIAAQRMVRFCKSVFRMSLLYLEQHVLCERDSLLCITKSSQASGSLSRLGFLFGCLLLFFIWSV